MKKFLCGLVIGGLLFAGPVVYAESGNWYRAYMRTDLEYICPDYITVPNLLTAGMRPSAVQMEKKYNLTTFTYVSDRPYQELKKEVEYKLEVDGFEKLDNTNPTLDFIPGYELAEFIYLKEGHFVSMTDGGLDENGQQFIIIRMAQNFVEGEERIVINPPEAKNMSPSEFDMSKVSNDVTMTIREKKLTEPYPDSVSFAYYNHSVSGYRFGFETLEKYIYGTWYAVPSAYGIAYDKLAIGWLPTVAEDGNVFERKHNLSFAYDDLSPGRYRLIMEMEKLSIVGWSNGFPVTESTGETIVVFDEFIIEGMYRPNPS